MHDSCQFLLLFITSECDIHDTNLYTICLLFVYLFKLHSLWTLNNGQGCWDEALSDFIWILLNSSQNLNYNKISDTLVLRGIFPASQHILSLEVYPRIINWKSETQWFLQIGLKINTVNSRLSVFRSFVSRFTVFSIIRHTSESQERFFYMIFFGLWNW